MPRAIWQDVVIADAAETLTVQPKGAARQFAGHLACWHGVTVEP
jgi:uncharacterized protein (DUF427 family)